MTTFLIVIFIAGYIAVASEHFIKVNKAATALITGALCWVIYMLGSGDPELVNGQLAHHLGEMSGILFFLMGAMTIVELIDAHDGFDLVTLRITQTDRRRLLWIVAFIAFFLSAVLDNLTTTIVMVSIVRKLMTGRDDRLIFAGMIIVAANAGGAWSPVGDVTTTMLWIGGQITALNIIAQLIVPSLISMLVPLLILSYGLRGKVGRPAATPEKDIQKLPLRYSSVVFFSGLLVLVLVPAFKTFTHLPPYMGILLGLGLLWVITEMIHGDKDEQDKHKLSVVYALRKIDTPSILFFFGLLAAIGCLQSTGVLTSVAGWLTVHIPDDRLVVICLGLLSAIVDNVPLVAAAQGMYPLTDYPADHYFWEFLAYCTGTGGSILVIGSAAGVAAMGMENISFLWYLKKIGIPALLGFLAGAGVYLLQSVL